MHTSYFLFVMVITMFCYAVIKGRPSKLRQNNPEFCPEKVSSGWVCLAPGDRPFSRKKKGSWHHDSCSEISVGEFLGASLPPVLPSAQESCSRVLSGAVTCD